METLYLKKQPKPGSSKEFVFVAPAVGMKTSEGMRFIPHPYGNETVSYDSLESAISHIHRAGYAVEFEGKLYSLPAQAVSSKPRTKGSSHGVFTSVIGMENAVRMLYEQLNDKVPSVVASAAFALGEMRDEGAIQGLVHGFGNEDATVRKNVAEAIAKIGKPALNAIQLALKDQHWLVRHTALSSIIELIHLNPELVMTVLPDAIPLLRDESWLVRSHSALVFGEAAKKFRERQEQSNA